MKPIRALFDRLRRRPRHRQEEWIYPLPDQRALYFAIPKIACTTWLRICCQAQGIDLATVDPAGWFDAIPHIAPGDLHRYHGWYRFGFVRNPWDRLVSCYLDKIRAPEGPDPPTFRRGIPRTFEPYGLFRGGMPFGEFVRAVASIPDAEADAHFRSQHCFFADGARDLSIDRIGRFEDVPGVFHELLQRLDIADFALPHDKRTKARQHASAYYGDDDRLIELVATRYATDVARFGYRFERRA